MQTKLKSLIIEYGCPTEDSIRETSIKNCTLSILQIRDLLYSLGNILYEDGEQQIYVASLRTGFGNMNTATVALQLLDHELIVVGYAKEGILKQKSCDKVFSTLEKAAHGERISIHSRNFLPIISFFSLAILAVILIIIRNPISTPEKTDFSKASNDVIAEETISPEEQAFIAEVEQIMEATREYNKAVLDFNSMAAEYNDAVLLTCIDNINGFPSNIDSLAAVSETFEDSAEVLKGSNSAEKIMLDTNTVLEMAEQVKQATAVVKQITAPSEVWVMERLNKVESITGMQAVSEDDNPDGLLKADGGYSSCIYFTIDAAFPEEVPGKTIVEKGTDAGGAIEVYLSLADAEARVEYLAGFDGTILYSGSYAIIGTMVIRTSYKLNDENQLALTDQITYALTALDM